MSRKKTDLLLTQVRQGDENAVAELLEKHREPIRRVARRLLGRALRPHLDSVDLLQLVHQTVLLGVRGQKIDLSKPEKIVAFAMTLLRRKIAFYWKKIKREPNQASNGRDRRANEATPADSFALSDEVEKLLRGLNPIDRKLLELRLDGYTTAEAARELGVDACSLRVRLGRLRKRLQERRIVEGSPKSD